MIDFAQDMTTAQSQLGVDLPHSLCAVPVDRGCCTSRIASRDPVRGSMRSGGRCGARSVDTCAGSG